MGLRKSAVFAALLWSLGSFLTGCRPYHHGGVGIEVDVHSKEYRDRHHREKDRGDNDHHDDNRHDDHNDN